jgi:myo-inositol-1(or 4)-monophosphatase
VDSVEVSSSPGEVLEFASNLAQQTGELLLGYFHRPQLNTSFKTDRTLVSEADLAADNMIKNAIQRRYPGQVLISEEISTTLQSSGKQDEFQHTWVIDPLDGTTNFCLGLHTWGILITRCSDGWPDLAVLHFPLLNELYTAHRNYGAWLNG